ncbi:HNH endonuclease signature motif containing protein [Modestobacter marinus]|uniref:HNH endonuclease signature motif containing protein n=1 Tax=Modestobacter marinus TaxID=477641 RepID=UPI0027E0DA67|nr:HNH endonuclease signature motif containing protein [Modestobacter marinus]
MSETSEHAAGGLRIDWVWERPVGLPRLPVGWLSAEDVAGELQRLQQRRAMDTAYEAELILALAADRPATLDPPADTPGARRSGWTAEDAAGVSEFFPAELAVVLNLDRGTAAIKLARAQTWRDKLPATFAALSAGELDERRAQALADVLMHTSPEIAGRVEAALLGQAGDLSVYRLRDRATALLLRLDAAAADERREQAARAADVKLHPSATDGRATLTADLPADEAAECHDLVDQLARMLKADGDARPIGQLRTHVLSLLIRRPADTGLPHVRAELTVTAALDTFTGTAPGEVNGLPITAAHVRELLARIGALGLTTPAGGTLSFAITGPDGELLATVSPAELARLARRGCRTHPEQADCGCAVLGPPPPTDAYQPTARQRSFVEARGRRCRFPNCGQRVGWADLDHVVPHADGGTTDCTNLCCLCRSHHRLKTFSRLALRHGRRRRAHRDHPVRRHPHHPTTGPTTPTTRPTGRTRATGRTRTAAGHARGRSATLVTGDPSPCRHVVVPTWGPDARCRRTAPRPDAPASAGRTCRPAALPWTVPVPRLRRSSRAEGINTLSELASSPVSTTAPRTRPTSASEECE